MKSCLLGLAGIAAGAVLALIFAPYLGNRVEPAIRAGEHAYRQIEHDLGVRRVRGSPNPTGRANPSPSGLSRSPTATGPTPPSRANCGWAVDTLKQDAVDDVQNNTDPSADVYYQKSADRWLQAASDLAWACGGSFRTDYWSGEMVTPATLTRDVSWLEFGYYTHQLDLSSPNADTSWDELWMSNYARLEQIFKSTGWAYATPKASPP